VFDGRYIDWNAKRIKGIIEFYGYKFFYYKRLLDLGCGHADISAALYRLGADVTAIDARPEHLKVANKKYPGIKTLQADLDQGWPFGNKAFDIILDLDLLCHLRDYTAHLRAVCAATTHLVLETTVCDSADPFKHELLQENKAIYDLSINGVSCRPSTAAIERVMAECGMNWKRLDNNRFNSGDYTYDWVDRNDGKSNSNNRRLWIAVKNTSPIQFARPIPPSPPEPPPSLIPPSLNFFQTANYRYQTTASQSPPVFFTPPSLSGHVPTAAPGGAPISNPPIRIRTRNFKHGKRFAIVIPSYNNAQWCMRNINSALNQNYDNFRVLFTDDCSKDNTFGLVKEAVHASGRANIATVHKNETRIGALGNLYNMIHSCGDDEIVLTLDGDDWLPNDNVLNRLNDIYSREDIWMTYGQYTNHPMGGVGVAAPYPGHVIDSNSFRNFTWGASHLRTFYAWLFKEIKKEDLMKDGHFYPMTWDLAMMFPMMEMSGHRAKYLHDILYVYNLENPINDHKVNMEMQQFLDRYIRGLPKYQRVDTNPFRTTVGLIMIATGKYDRFIQGMISSADNYFLNDYDVSYYIFTDSNAEIVSRRPVIKIPIEHRPFPYASMDRFKHFTQHADKFVQEEYLFYVDVDCLFVDTVNNAIIEQLVGVRHCGHLDGSGPFENNTKSTSYIEPAKRKFYYGGGFSGGKREQYLELAKWCSEALEEDQKNGIIPIYHDESILNKYFADHPPTLNLSPSYHYPQTDIERYKTKWGGHNWQPKILLLDKDHIKIRS